MQVMEVATADGPQAAGVVAAAPSLTVDASPATASAKATAAAAAAAAASAQKKSAKILYNKKFSTHQNYNKKFVDPPKVQATPPEILNIFVDPPKVQWPTKSTATKKDLPNSTMVLNELWNCL
jgi:hypothetical protein